MLSLIGYQFDRVVTEERRRHLGIVQGKDFLETYRKFNEHFVSAFIYKLIYSEVFNQAKVYEQGIAILRKSDTLYYGVKGAGMQK